MHNTAVPKCFYLPPAVVGICSVRLGHLVQLKLLLDDVALFVKGIQQFLREFFIHGCAFVFVFSAFCDHPFHCKEAASAIFEWDGHLGIGDKYNHQYIYFVAAKHTFFSKDLN